MIGAGTGQAGTLAKSDTNISTRVGGLGSTYAGMTTNVNLNPKNEKMQKDLFTWMQTDRANQYEFANKSMQWNGGLQAGKLGAETLVKSMDSIFTHVANMKQLNTYNKYLDNQADIARRSINLESKKLDVTKEMQNDQLRFQLKVAQYQKETAVTVTAIQEKGKTKRVQALAALRSVYGRGNPVSPFQRFMT